MHRGLRVAVVVPAYNEGAHIGCVLAGIPPWVDAIFVVDDGSEDDTAEVARSSGDARLVLLRHPRNRGVGAAVATGYLHAFRADADVAVVMAGDAQMDPRDLKRLLGPIVAGAPYAKGDRLRWPGVEREMPLTRLLGNHALSWLTRRATGLDVRDSQCGYTALSRIAYEQLDLRSLWRRYGYPNDLLGRLAAARLASQDVPVRPIYGAEASGVRPWDALFVIPALLVSARLRRWSTRSEAACASGC